MTDMRRICGKSCWSGSCVETIAFCCFIAGLFAASCAACRASRDKERAATSRRRRRSAHQRDRGSISNAAMEPPKAAPGRPCPTTVLPSVEIDAMPRCHRGWFARCDTSFPSSHSCRLQDLCEASV